MSPAGDPPPAFSYQGPHFWPISAAFSLFGSSSLVLSMLSGRLGGGPFGDSVLFSLGVFILLFFLAALLTGFAGGLTLLMTWKLTPGSLTIRGKTVSERALWRVLMFCYASPWILVAAFFLFLPRMMH